MSTPARSAEAERGLRDEDCRTLQDRWTAPSACAARKEIVAKLSRSGKLDPSLTPFGSHRGRFDLRGLGLPSEAMLHRAEVRNADLSASDLRWLRLDRCCLVDVIFDRADLGHLIESGSTFERCSFAGTMLDDAVIGLDRSKYDGCSFDRASFARATFIGPHLVRCRLDHCALDGRDLNATVLRDSSIAGALRDVVFRKGCSPVGAMLTPHRTRVGRLGRVDLSRATLLDVRFAGGCSLSRVTLGSAHLLYGSWQRRLKRARARVRSLEPGHRHAVLTYIEHLRAISAGQHQWILDIRCLWLHLGVDGTSSLVQLLGKPHRAPLPPA